MKIGLTGGIGCGKSTATRFFSEEDWKTIDTDSIVRDLLADDEAVRDALRERWGRAVFQSDGTVDRKAVAERVFASEGELGWLESLLHPRVRARWKAALQSEPEVDWLVEIPLLFEKSLESEFDLVVCVESSEAVVRERMAARGFSEADLAKRRRRQMPLPEKVRLADHVLSNSGNLDFLKEQILNLSHRIRAGATSR